MKYTIIGAARSGLAAATLATNLGHEVFVSESKNAGEMKQAKEKLEKEGIEHEFGGNTARALEADEIIVSPGVPPTAQVIVEAEKKGIPIISEFEFAWRQVSNPVIAITGTNGKTTTTALTEHIFKNSGRDAVACGNIGLPLSAVVPYLKPETVVVVELSSFQLERIRDFAPDVAVILNITPDHVGYHGSLEKYIAAKWKISSKQSRENFLFLNKDNEACSGGTSGTDAETAWFSMSPVERGIFFDDGRMKIRFDQQHTEEEIMLYDELSLPGVHNAYNSMAAALAARAFEISNENIRDALMSFRGVEHRLEFVRSLGGVDYINDSKATNVNATWYALQSYKKPLIWIAGGRGDNNDYSALDHFVKENVKEIIAIGEEQEAIFNHFCTMKRCHKEDTLQSAVRKASENAVPGEIVLFTPACKSFDMFMNYEHRGEVFKECVYSL